ncbi:MAG: hypothetical protein ACRENW_00080, partial [Thermodesulfobacteriota bacterium]
MIALAEYTITTPADNNTTATPNNHMSGASFLGTLSDLADRSAPGLAGGDGRGCGASVAPAWLACTPLPREGRDGREPPIPQGGLG